MAKGLTLSIIFQANGLNYGENMGNVSELKKLSRGNGHMYTFASRQCLRYEMVRLGKELFDWNLQTVTKEKGVVQFDDEYTIQDSEEMDLFGYMRTKKNARSNVRSAVARVTHAISLEPYRSDIDFLNNMGLAQRINENNDLANVEQHNSFYTYTLTIDLEQVGVDGELILSNEERAKRVNQLLTVVNLLNRRIRGRQENLSPLFIIGGVYPIANPFFLGRIQIDSVNHDYQIKEDPIQDGLEKSFMGTLASDFTRIGLVKGIFGNESNLQGLLSNGQTGSVQEFFTAIEEEINQYYQVSINAGT